MHRLLLALVCLSICTPAFAQADAAKLDAVKEFKTYFKKFKEEPQQVEAVMTLKGNECRPAAEELVKLLKHPSALVQQAALTVIETFPAAATFQLWIDELPKITDQQQKATLVKVLGHARIAAALPALKALALEPKAPPTVKYEVARALQRLGDKSVGDAVQALLGDADPLVRMAAADCAGALNLRELGPKVIPLISDSEWQVQTAAVTAVGLLRPQEAIQPLIDLMKKPGRVRTECADSLFRITTYDFGVDADMWQKQWTRMQSTPGWRIPTEEELAKKAAARKKADQFYGKKEQHNTFAGIQTTSTRVLFIIDVSGSMDDLVVEKEKFQGYADFKKFTVVKTELLHAVESLTAETQFDICAFATDLHPWKKQLVPANLVNREAAKTWIEHLAPLGGNADQDLAQAGLSSSANLNAGKTNTIKALMYAFGIDPEVPTKAVFTGSDKAALKNKLDTVYFLSDGRPSIGKLIDTNEIQKEVRRVNETYRIVIHTVAIGEFQKEFMKDLATQNGGVFVDMGR
jgi:hypothetical protein